MRLTDEAEADLRDIFDFVSSQASVARAQAYVNRIIGFLAGLDVFPERGTIREDIKPGLRIIGFERSACIAFLVEGDSVVILRVLYAGRQVEFGA
ncbi:type II toxin-antitoxin system RelE/ParE family toxin [Allomesorhizobium camelthorni]|uniref:type II toxin-antitoxin system RelE/ParE family toxin n=1 Tax=Allomesorhizobium camelthorni TaxID=475069 RepID=UPI0031B611DA